MTVEVGNYLNPGIYRFTLIGEHTSFYVGESDNLARRMAGYRRPGPTQHTNIRMKQRFQDILAGGGAIEVAVVLEASFDDEPLDFLTKPARLLVKNAALVDLIRAGATVENL